MWYFKSLRFRLVLITGVLQLIVLILCIIAATISTERLLHQADYAMAEVIDHTIEHLIEEWEETARGYARIFAHEPSAAMIAAIKNRDTDTIIALAKPVFDYSTLDGMTFSDMDGIALARVISPGVFGDYIGTSPAIADGLAGISAVYVYATPDNGLSITASAPIYDGNEQIGALIVSKRIDHPKILEELSDMTFSEIIVYTNDTPTASTITSAYATQPLPADIKAALINTGEPIILTDEKFEGINTMWIYMPVWGRSGELVGTVLAIHEEEANAWIVLMWTFLFIGLAVVIIPILLVNIRKIGIPIRDLAKKAEQVGQGNLSVVIENTNREDEIGTLQRTLHILTNIIHDLLDDIAELTSKFNKEGDLEHRIESDKYNGSYKDVAEGVNAFADSFVHDVLMLLNIIDEIGKGNFEPAVEKLPGKKIILNQKIDTLLSNLRNVSAEIEKLALGATVGDLDVRADAAKYQGDWGKLLDELNELVSAVSEPFREIEYSLSEMANGYFIAMTGDYKGVFDNIKQSFNTSEEITKSYIDEIAELLDAIAKGDLTVTINHEYIGSYAPIEQALNTILSSLRNTMMDIDAAAEQVLAGSRQISETSMVLAEGTSRQASSIEELNASIDIVSEKTNLNSDYAANANEVAVKSNQHANEGSDAMQSMVQSMDSIKQSSENISKIINSIEDIAFQTNLLALNAAVEAARAGEHGKGFAVVAEEVRNLAAKSQESAKDTTTIIAESNSKVEVGTGAANDAATTLETIVDDVSQVSGIITKIAELSREQADYIAQISEGINEISDVVQTNSATSQECAAASQEMNSQSEKLKQLVSFFKFR